MKTSRMCLVAVFFALLTVSQTHNAYADLKPSSAKRAKLDWKKIRKEPDKHPMREVTWKVKVTFNHESRVSAYLDGDWHFGVHLSVFSRDSYGTFYQRDWSEAVAEGFLPNVVRDDWIVFTGSFVKVSNTGDLLFAVTEVKNLGP